MIKEIKDKEIKENIGIHYYANFGNFALLYPCNRNSE